MSSFHQTLAHLLQAPSLARRARLEGWQAPLARCRVGFCHDETGLQRNQAQTRARQRQVQAAEPVAAGREAVVTVSVPQSAEEAHSALLAGEELETGEVPGPSPAPVCGQRLSHRKPEWDWRGRHHAEPADAADAGEVRKESSLALPGSTAPASVPVALADSNSDAARRGVRGVSGEGPAPTSSAAPAQGRDQYCVLNF